MEAADAKPVPGIPTNAPALRIETAAHNLAVTNAKGTGDGDRTYT